LVERLVWVQKVVGSNPVTLIKLLKYLKYDALSCVNILGVCFMSNVGYNRSSQASRSVIVHSDQTTKKYGDIDRVEHDRVWGPQYLVTVNDHEWGSEQFWMRRHEISFR